MRGKLKHWRNRNRPEPLKQKNSRNCKAQTPSSNVLAPKIRWPRGENLVSEGRMPSQSFNHSIIPNPIEVSRFETPSRHTPWRSTMPPLASPTPLDTSAVFRVAEPRSSSALLGPREGEYFVNLCHVWHLFGV